MSWDPAQGKGLPAKRKAPVISAGNSNSCGASVHPLGFQRQPAAAKEQQGGVGRGGVGRGRERRLGGFPAPPGHWACAVPRRMRRKAEATGWGGGGKLAEQREGLGRGLERGSAREPLARQVWGGVPYKLTAYRTKFVETL